jgi:hypothetical protein
MLNLAILDKIIGLVVRLGNAFKSPALRWAVSMSCGPMVQKDSRGELYVQTRSPEKQNAISEGGLKGIVKLQKSQD